MNITRTDKITLSGAEVRAAIKAYFPNNILLRSMPTDNGRVKFELKGVNGTMEIEIARDITEAQQRVFTAGVENSTESL